MAIVTRCAVVCILWTWVSAPLSAQTTGTLLGRVTDPTDAVVPGATVEVQNVGTGLVRTGVTDLLGTVLDSRAAGGDLPGHSGITGVQEGCPDGHRR